VNVFFGLSQKFGVWQHLATNCPYWLLSHWIYQQTPMAFGTTRFSILALHVPTGAGQVGRWAFHIGCFAAGWMGAIAAFIAFTLPFALRMFAFSPGMPISWQPILSARHYWWLKLVARLQLVAPCGDHMAQKTDSRLATYFKSQLFQFYCLCFQPGDMAKLPVIILGGSGLAGFMFAIQTKNWQAGF